MPKNDLVRGIDLTLATATFTGAGAGAVGASGMEVHDLDGPWHSGTLPWASLDTAGSSLADLATRAHGDLTGIGANDHHNQSHVLATTSALGGDHTVSGLTAGYVLRASGATTAAFAAIQDADLPATIVRTSRQINSGAGLTGGGNLGADLTLNVGAGTLITVGIDDVGITAGSAYQYIGTGSGTAAAWQNLSGLAGDGLAHATGALAVGAGAGITVNTNDVALTTPGTLTVATSNSASGSHTHAITSSSNPGAAAAILASTGSGGLTLQTLTVQGNVDITSGGDLTVGANILFVDVSQVSVGINGAPDPQFALDVYGPARAEYWIGPHALQIKNSLLIAHYDGRAPFESNYTGESNGHMGQVATITGGAIWREGKFNKAIQIAPATTNLITNPSFETNTTSWAAFGGASITRSASGGSVTGSYVLVVNRPSSTTDGVSYTHFTSTQGTYYFSFSVKASGTHIGKKVYAFMRFSYSDATFTDTTAYNHTLTGEWERIYSSGTTNGAKTLTHITLFARDLSGGGTAHTWLMDSVQLELDQLTPYCDGSMGDGHSWSGTAHASTSSRTAATLSYPTSGNINPLAGTVAAWIKPSKVSGTHYILRIDGSGSSYIILRYAGGVAGAYWGTAGVNGTTAIPIESWSHLAMTYDGATVTIYLNGQLETSIASSGFATMPASMQVGHASSASHLNGLLDDLLITSDCKTATEILAIYESNAPVFAETSKYGFRTTSIGLIWADDEGLWGRNVLGQPIIGLYGGEAATKSWAGLTLASGDFVIGDSSRGGYLLWDDSAALLAIGRSGTNRIALTAAGVLSVNDSGGAAVFTFDASAGAEFTKPLTMGTNGGIYQGTGTFASPTTGLKIANSSGVGTITGYNAGVAQWYGSTDGKFYAGAGTLVIDASGIRTTGDTSGTIDFASIRSYRFHDGSLNYGGLYGASNGTGATADKFIVARAQTANASADANLWLQAYNTAGGMSNIFLQTDEGEVYLETNAGVSSFRATADTITLAGTLTPTVISQTSTTGATPTLQLTQLDLSEELIEFVGTVSAGNPINTTALGAYYGRVRVSVNGTFKWLALYS